VTVQSVPESCQTLSISSFTKRSPMPSAVRPACSTISSPRSTGMPSRTISSAARSSDGLGTS
jgi:hypothetical protein